MYSDDIKDLKKQKREANRLIFLDFVVIYLKLRIGFPNLLEERNTLVRLVQMYFEADENESEVLNCIQKHYANVEDNEILDELLDDFDEKFENLYAYCQDTFHDYNSFLAECGSFMNLIGFRLKQILGYKNIDEFLKYRYWLKLRPPEFPIFDKEYKEKMLQMVPNLPESKEEEF